jgi:hypothetical protein
MTGDDLDKPATRRDLREAVQEFKTYVLERELGALRWIVGIQAAYFAITLSAVWFLVSALNNQVLRELAQISARLPK